MLKTSTPKNVPLYEISDMEPEIKAFLKRVAQSIFMGFLWMVINSTIGIMYDFAFVHDKISPGNILFYAWFLLSLGFLLWYLIRLWKKSLASDPSIENIAQAHN